MEGSVGREFHGRVICLPIHVIEALITKERLESIHLPAMNSFLGLVSKTFEYYNQADDPTNLQFLKNKLHERARVLGSTEEVNPFGLYQAFQADLLIRNSPAQDLYCEDLWVAYFEFLIISCLIDGVQEMDFSYVEDNSARRRFLFSADKENWVWRLMDIFRSDFRGLRRDGKIVVSTGDKSGRMQAKDPQLEKIVVNIGRGQVSDLMVDAGIVNPATEFKVYHLTGLHKVCVLDNENDLGKFYAGGKGCGEPELMDVVRRLYSAHI
ncbi:hypothetical protein D9M70_503980 [compost metagenome]